MRIKGNISNVSCASCMRVIHSVVDTHQGSDLKINLITGHFEYEIADEEKHRHVKKELEQLGYPLKESNTTDPPPTEKQENEYDWLLIVSVVLTLPLLLGHFFHYLLPWVMDNAWIQLVLCVPVYVIGWIRIGKSGLRSLLKRKPNMNVLIIGGATASFVYSLIVLWMGGEMLFFETTSSIITLVMLGEFFEHRSMMVTQREIKKLIKHQQVGARMIAFDEHHQEVYFDVPSETLKVGDLILIKTGERIPADCKILSGDCLVDESLLTGESMPIHKAKKEMLYGGSILVSGTIKAQVHTENSKAVLSKIIEMVEQAQLQKPPIQTLADRVSAIFVPLVFSLATLTFLGNYLLFDVGLTESIMRSIAVLVIACPCALGMATPAAISIGMGIASKRGIFFKKAKEIENFKNIRQVIFDKTGTLTEGHFLITDFGTTLDEPTFKGLVCQMEKSSNHPIAKSILAFWEKEIITYTDTLVHVTEHKAKGMFAEDREGNVFKLGSAKILPTPAQESHTLYLTKNDEVIGWLDMKDEIRKESKALIQKLQRQNITCILLSGDKHSVCEEVAKELGIQQFFAEKSPDEKLHIVQSYTAKAPTVMIGDGINDAPSLSAATIGIAVGEASQLSIQAATVVFTNKSVGSVYSAIRIGQMTYQTIVSNLVWAFGYNIVAIPIAACGILNPTLGALVMGLSDVFLVVNSLTLYLRKYR